MCGNLEAEKRLLCDDHLIYALSYDDLLKEKNYLVTRMNVIDEKKRDLIKQKTILETLSGKITKRIKEMQSADNNKKMDDESKKVKRLELLESVGHILSELEIDTTKIDEEVRKLKELPKIDPKHGNI